MLILSVFSKVLKVMKVIPQKHIKITFLAVFIIKLFVFMINLQNQLLLIEVKMLLINLLEQVLKSLITIMNESNEKAF